MATFCDAYRNIAGSEISILMDLIELGYGNSYVGATCDSEKSLIQLM